MTDDSEVWTYELNDRPFSSFIVLYLHGVVRGHLITRSKHEQEQVIRLLNKAGVKSVADNSTDQKRD